MNVLSTAHVEAADAIAARSEEALALLYPDYPGQCARQRTLDRKSVV